VKIAKAAKADVVFAKAAVMLLLLLLLQLHSMCSCCRVVA
jgi:hypothetical protein